MPKYLIRLLGEPWLADLAVHCRMKSWIVVCQDDLTFLHSACMGVSITGSGSYLEVVIAEEEPLAKKKTG
jgi:hypothetical protein